MNTNLKKKLFKDYKHYYNNIINDRCYYRTRKYINKL